MLLKGGDIMLSSPMEVLSRFPVRKSNRQKQLFRDSVQTYAQDLGYTVAVENAAWGGRNLIIGDPESARYLVTAHYDTPARLPFPNAINPCNFFVFILRQAAQWLGIMLIAVVLSVAAGLTLGEEWTSITAVIGVYGCLLLMLIGPANPSNANDNTSGVVTLLEIARTLPQNRRDKVCFVLFDLEEAGLLGSGSYRRKHKKVTQNQLVLNLDCVGDGDHIRMFPTKKLRKDRKKCTALYQACGYFGKKDILVHEKGFYTYPSDQKRFPYGVGICALHKGKAGLYLSRIHTSKDTCLDINNINILRAALTSFICCDEVY